MVDLFKKQRVVIYEIEEGVEFNVGTMPNVTIGTMPNVVVGSGTITVGSGTVTIDGGDVNIASKYNLAKFGTMSYDYGTFTAPSTSLMAMLDDNTETYFQFYTVAAGVKTAWVKWDLGESKTIKTVLAFISMLENGGHELCTCTLQGSANDSNWTAIDSATGTGETGNGTYDNLLGVNETYRYFRILLEQTGTGTSNILFIYDLQLII